MDKIETSDFMSSVYKTTELMYLTYVKRLKIIKSSNGLDIRQCFYLQNIQRFNECITLGGDSLRSNKTV